MLRTSSNSRQRGNAIVEFAFVLPVLIIITFGIVDVGRYAYYSIVIANAARAGAAYAAQNERTLDDATGIASAVTADAGNAASMLSAPTTSYTCQNSSFQTVNCLDNQESVAWQYVQVTVQGTFNPLLSYPGLPGSLTISNTANMRVLCSQGC